MDELLRSVVAGIKDYVPGRTVTGAVKLASNENPFGPSPLALEAIAKEAHNLHIYPDQRSTLLREALAKHLGVGDDSILCGNGSDDIMQVLGSTYLNPGDEVIISQNTFSLYELITRIFDGKIVTVELKDYELDLEGFARALTTKTKLVFLTNPNNPTGTAFSAAQFDALLAKVPPTALVIVDEAYIEFAERADLPNTLAAVRAGKNIVVLRTFSKYYGLAGLRIGYGVARPDILRPMFRTKMPFNVNRLAQAGALAALDDKEFLAKTYQNNLEGKKYLYAEFDRLGLAYKKTEANFIFVDLKKSADELFMALMKQGVIIRPLTSFGFPSAIRVSIGTKEQNEKFIAALKSLS
ncbi:MAG: histidinol-phosphate transaminase [Candidatus Margulisiibacteriota bacterium]